MLSITVLLCTMAALHKMKEGPRRSLWTYIHVQISGAHTQSSEGLMTFLDRSSCIWGNPWHSAALHFQGFIYQKPPDS